MFQFARRVPIFGKAGLNRRRGRAIGHPTIGMTRIALTRATPKYDPCYPKYDPCYPKYDPCCSMPELPDCEEFKDIKCAIKEFLCQLSDDQKKKNGTRPHARSPIVF